MPHFRRPRSSYRREPRRTARSIVLGHSAAPILYHGRRAHLQTYTSRDHAKRYQTGQRLAVREYFPGPAECHVILTDVTGPADEYTLGQVDYATARELGHHRVDAFRVAWVIAHDHDWLAEHLNATEDEFLARFARRWASKRAWLLRFNVDIAEPPRLLAASGHVTGRFVVGPDNRWTYAERDEDREGDRGYTSIDSLSLRDEKPALTDDEWKLHVDANRDLTHDQWVALGRMTRLERKRRRPPKHLRNAA